MNVEAMLDLRCHQVTPSDGVRAIHVSVRRTSAELDLRFRLEADISGIRITPPSEPQGVTELWRHTCFETFVAIEGQAAYHEFNFAPSREWWVYAFRAYRDPAPHTKASHSPAIDVSATDQRLELQTRIHLKDLSPVHSHSPLRLGVCAVIESQNGSLSYWALLHPAGQPDFHHADAFALRLEAPESEG